MIISMEGRMSRMIYGRIRTLTFTFTGETFRVPGFGSLWKLSASVLVVHDALVVCTTGISSDTGGY
jgi:hypothetical protein